MSERREPVALLCGASRGIGYAVAEVMAREGFRLILNGREPAAAAERLRLRGLAVDCVAGDVAEPRTADDLVAAAERAGGLDALFLNHGGPPVRTFLEVSDEDWENGFRMIVQGPLRLLRRATPLFRERGGGRVVGISSFVAKTPFAGMLLSQSLRAAFVNALKTAALELGPDGILVNAVAPGYVATERLAGWNEAQAKRAEVTPEEFVSQARSRIPLRRYGAPEEVAELVAFLLSRRNGYVTGQHILVDGGLVTAS